MPRLLRRARRSRIFTKLDSQSPFIQRYEPVRRLVFREKLPGCANTGFAVCAGTEMAAVVEDNVHGLSLSAEAIDFFGQACGDAIRGWLFPIVGHRVPKNRFQAEGTRDLKDLWPARTEGRAKESDRLANDLFKGCAGPLQFFMNLCACGQCQVGMAPRVIADQVTGSRDAPHQCRFDLGEFADHEKRSTHVVAGEDVEQARRP